MTAVVDGSGSGGSGDKELSFDEMLALGESLPPPPPPWWRQFLVFDKDGKLDFEKTTDDLFGIPRHDVTSAKIILIRHQEEFFYIALDDKRGAKGQIRIWNGRVWESDLNDGTVSAWVQQFWKALRRALDTVKGYIQSVGEQKLAEFLATGMTEEAARKRLEGVIKPMNARLMKFEQYWEGLGKNTNQRALITQMCSERTLVCKDDEFDSVPEFLVVPNGVFDLGVTESTGGSSLDLLPHSSARRVTMMSHVEYRPGVDCPMFKKYLEEVLPDPDTREYLQKALGSSLLGKPKDKKLINLVGPTNSGKSILLEVIRDVLGEYCDWLNPQVLMAKKGVAKDPDKASPSLHATRLSKIVVASEPDSGDRWDSGLLKALTGRDYVKSRNLYGQFVNWTPRYLIVIASNDFVKLSVEDEALVQRIAPIKFPKSYVLPFKDAAGEDVWPEGTPEDQRADKHLSERIRASEDELSGVLNWLLEGLQMYLRDGLGETDAIRAERLLMESDNSLVVSWLEARVAEGVLGRLTLEEAARHGKALGSVVAKKDRVLLKEAWHDFCAWYADEGYGEGGRGSDKPPIGKMTFSKVLGKKASSTKEPASLAGAGTGFDLLFWADGTRGADTTTAALTEAWRDRDK